MSMRVPPPVIEEVNEPAPPQPAVTQPVGEPEPTVFNPPPPPRPLTDEERKGRVCLKFSQLPVNQGNDAL